MKKIPDLIVRDEGTLFLFCPLTPKAKAWIDEHVQPDATWYGNALVVEHRYAWALVGGMNDAGLTIA
jgi:hypothetical protein